MCINKHVRPPTQCNGCVRVVSYLCLEPICFIDYFTWFSLQEEREHFPLQLVENPIPFTNRERGEIYNNVLVFTVVEERGRSGSSDMHIFQVNKHPVRGLMWCSWLCWQFQGFRFCAPYCLPQLCESKKHAVSLKETALWGVLIGSFTCNSSTTLGADLLTFSQLHWQVREKSVVYNFFPPIASAVLVRAKVWLFTNWM